MWYTRCLGIIIGFMGILSICGRRVRDACIRDPTRKHIGRAG